MDKEEFKRLINGEIRPHYTKDADYQTNAPSFYEYLARNNELLQLLAERIWGYDEEIQEYFQRWEDNLSTINDEVIQMMITWLEDGTLADIINNELFNRKVEIYLQKNEPVTDFENSYWNELVTEDDIQIRKKELTLWKKLFPLTKTRNVSNEEGITLDDLLIEKSDEIQQIADDLDLRMTTFETTTNQKIDDYINTPIYDGGDISYKRHYAENGTVYYLTEIPMKDKSLEYEIFPNDPKTIEEFAKEKNTVFASNGGQYTSDGSELRSPVIVNGEIIYNDPRADLPHRQIMAIKNNGKLTSYPSQTDANIILQDDVKHAFSDFITLIENYQLRDDLFNIHEGVAGKHPRNVIGQKQNGDLVYLTCGGRGIGGIGLSGEDVAKIIQRENVKFAFLLDGGGSTQTVIRGNMINPTVANTSDNHIGLSKRKRPSSLYIKAKGENPKDKDVQALGADLGQLRAELNYFNQAQSVEWTPKFTGSFNNIAGIQYGEQNGTTVRLGNLVIAFFEIYLKNKGTDDGTKSLELTGLPYHFRSDSIGIISTSLDRFPIPKLENTVSIHGFIADGRNYMKIGRVTDSGATGLVTVDDLVNDSYYRGTIIYTTDFTPET